MGGAAGRGPTLVVRAGALGDLLLLRPAIASLRRAGHAVVLLAPEPADVLVGTGPAGAAARLPWESAAAAALLSDDGPPRGALREALAGCHAALAYTRNAALVGGLERLVPRVVAHDPAPPEGAGHAATWLARPLARLGVKRVATAPLLAPTALDLEAAQPWLRSLPEGFLAIHPGSGSTRKNWPFERFLELAGRLSPGRPWLLIEGPAEPPRPAPAARVVVAREPPLRALLALVARAGLFVGNDSGVSHLAAAAGAPTLALFGPTDPAVWSPLGPRVLAPRAASARLEDLEVEAAEAAARRLLADERSPAT